MMRRLALLACVLLVPLYLMGTSGRALHNGDEAIYAEMAREMVDGGDWVTPRWQGEPILARPPGTVWLLAAARRLVGDPSEERAVRWPNALCAALQAALLMLLGAALYSPSVGLLAAGLLATSDLFVGYARYLESEPLLGVFIVGALACWEAARARPRWIVGWGALLGAALLTKQVIGALPLVAPLVDWLPARDPPRRVGRGALAVGLVVALAVAAPWHALAAARHPSLFTEQFLGALVRRSTEALHHQTSATFYLRELWRSEGGFGLLALVGVAAALWRRRRADWLIAAWALGSFAVFSASRSRYDYYILVAYPALALATAALVLEHVPARIRVRQFAAAALLLTAAAAHLPRNLASFDGDDEVRALARAASARLAPPARLYVYNRHPYSARYYSRLDVTTLLESADDLRLAEAYRRAGLPNAPLHAPDLLATLRAQPRPFALMLPRKRAELVGAALPLLDETPRYLLYRAE
jgi:4-amino-4-deoxy-L-arabinose transferase-like glycosyltransferase